MPADGLLAGVAGLETAAAMGGAGLLAAAARAATETAEGEAAGSMSGTAGEATDTTGGVEEGSVSGAEDTTMAGTLLETDEREDKDTFKVTYHAKFTLPMFFNNNICL